MTKGMYTHVKNNSKWVLNYNRNAERGKLNSFFESNDYLDNEGTRIVDIGCGNGRSTTLLLEIFDNSAKIVGIDKLSENILQAQQTIKNPNVSFLAIDAFDYFEKKDNRSKFDIAFFSWSLFDMTNESDFKIKKAKLHQLIESVKKCLKANGVIVVLQPTKGGVFEQLLSEFLPGSDADYRLVHDFLIEAGFEGGTSPFPDAKDPWAIWSRFNYGTKEDIYHGVASIVYLEQRVQISPKYFEEVFENFANKNRYNISDMNLTDCVNMYYMKMENCE